MNLTALFLSWAAKSARKRSTARKNAARNLRSLRKSTLTPALLTEKGRHRHQWPAKKSTLPLFSHYLCLLFSLGLIQLLHFPVNFLETLLDAMNVLFNGEVLRCGIAVLNHHAAHFAANVSCGALQAV